MKTKLQLELETHEVPEKIATSVAEMSDTRLAKAYFLNAIPALLAGRDSVFWDLHAAVWQEMKRRGLKRQNKLN